VIFFGLSIKKCPKIVFLCDLLYIYAAVTKKWSEVDTSKPADAYEVRCAWQVGGEKPASGEDLPKTKFSRKTICIVTHTEADKAKTAYYATCYENSKGDTGPWSLIIEAVIG
jgi:hypothetical protein